VRAVAKSKPRDRSDLFVEAAARHGFTPQIIEKDFWVCWILDRLFSAMGGAALTFKGGTSLSKVYGVIERFSEDIDLSFERQKIGVEPEDEPARAKSNKQRKQLVGHVVDHVIRHIRDEFVPQLARTIEAELGTGVWELSVDPRDPQTVLFRYPAGIEEAAEYVNPVVRLELGARGEPWPAHEGSVAPYAADVIPDAFAERRCTVRVLAAERTFWEKATILHSHHHREGTHSGERISRHYYDLVRLADSRHGAAALNDIDLLEHVVEHKKLFFPSAWAHYDSARPGSIRLLPREDQLRSLRMDYERMRGMFFAAPPTFDAMLEHLRVLEDQINGQHQTPSDTGD
jgi:hypothetical protein